MCLYKNSYFAKKNIYFHVIFYPSRNVPCPSSAFCISSSELSTVNFGDDGGVKNSSSSKEKNKTSYL